MAHRHRYLADAPCKCGQIRDAASKERGARNRKRGNAIEQRVMTELGAKRLGQHGLAEDGLGDHFVIQVKSRKTGAFPGWLAEELELLGTMWGKRERMPMVVVVEAPGPGKPSRRIAVIKLHHAAQIARLLVDSEADHGDE